MNTPPFQRLGRRRPFFRSIRRWELTFDLLPSEETGWLVNFIR